MDEARKTPSRREVLAAGLGGALLLGASPPSQEGARPAAPREAARTMLTRPIPRSGELLPVIGLGTWQTFNVGTDAKERAPLKDVLKRFLDAGGRVIDSSPMYDRAETVVGELLESLGQSRTPFLASKVWTMGRVEGEQQMRTSVQRMGRGRMDLMQVHNLVDARTHLATLREWQEAERVRYIGVTHYQRTAFDTMEKLIRQETLDFVQLPYSLQMRDAEQRLLPACAERGVAVLVMSPFEQGGLFERVRGKPLPPWAAEFDCTSWAQFFLKFILGHPAVTCPIPATSNPKHLEDNLKAGFGRLPDEKMRAKMVKHLGL
jgi:aryl-alcohol dehydrogenase-like predicted oxidoreductase